MAIYYKNRDKDVRYYQNGQLCNKRQQKDWKKLLRCQPPPHDVEFIRTNTRIKIVISCTLYEKPVGHSYLASNELCTHHEMQRHDNIDVHIYTMVDDYDALNKLIGFIKRDIKDL